MQRLHSKGLIGTEIYEPPSSSTHLAFPGATGADDGTLDCRPKLNQGLKRKELGSGGPLRSLVCGNQIVSCDEPQSDQKSSPKRQRTEVDKLLDCNNHLAVRLYQGSRYNATTQRPHPRSSAEPLDAKGPAASLHEQSPSQFVSPEIQTQENSLSLVAVEFFSQREDLPHTTKRMRTNSIRNPLAKPLNHASSKKSY